jgi:hypothetical protein
MITARLAPSAVEATRIEDLPDIDGVPPCETLFRYFPDLQCGKPSVVRVIVTCRNCNTRVPHFLCRECYDEVRKDQMPHAGCVDQDIINNFIEVI